VTEAGPVGEIASFILEEDPTEDSVVLGVHHTDYLIRLIPSVAPADFPVPASRRNRRIRGTVEGRALKMHRADAGGRFIEPVHGQPRIVQGTVCRVDAANDRILMDIVVPMWITVETEVTGQDASDFQQGELLNFYLESGTRFIPEG
jgi:hypothetical protein